MTKLRQEIDKTEADGEISDPISDKEARGLPYLNAVEKEAMRLHPSVGLLLERHVPPGGATICGKHIPAGTIVGVNPWVTQHDPEVFPEPEAFKPERWLPPNDGKKLDKYITNFSKGTRGCVGIK